MEGIQLAMRKNLFTERVIKHWSGLPREVVESPSVGLVGVVMFSQKLDLMILEVFCNFSDSVILWNVPYSLALRIKVICFRVGLWWS